MKKMRVLEKEELLNINGGFVEIALGVGAVVALTAIGAYLGYSQKN